MLNSCVAETLKVYADQLEKSKNFEVDLHKLIQKTIKEHKRIIFNGNGYDDAWIEEAEKRGLSNLKTTPDAVAHYLDQKNKDLFISHKVYSEAEMVSRHEVFLDKYCKLLHIEAMTMLEMAKQDILPAVSSYSSTLADNIIAKDQIGIKSEFESKTLSDISEDMKSAFEAYSALSESIVSVEEEEDLVKKADTYKDVIKSQMEALRASCDKLETETAAEFWPFPTYGELLFAVR
jgi:glutamine synthetase